MWWMLVLVCGAFHGCQLFILDLKLFNNFFPARIEAAEEQLARSHSK